MTPDNRKQKTAIKYRRMLRDWNDGMTTELLAAKYEMTKPSVREIIYRLRKEGRDATRRQRGRSQLRKVSLIRDWNAGENAEVLAAKYGYSTTQSLYHALSIIRARGADVVRRHTPTATTKAMTARNGFVADWNADMSVADLGEKYHLKNPTSYASELRARGMGLKRRDNFPSRDPAVQTQVIALRRDGMSLNQIAEAIGTSRESVRRLLIKLGVQE